MKQFTKRSSNKQTITVPAHAAYYRELREFVRCGAERAGLGQDCTFDLLIAVSEAAANAIEHGSPLGSGNRVELSWQFSRGRFEVVIRDQGRFQEWRPPELDGLGGRGIFLMQALVDEMTFHTTSEGTVVQLVVHAA